MDPRQGIVVSAAADPDVVIVGDGLAENPLTE